MTSDTGGAGAPAGASVSIAGPSILVDPAVGGNPIGRAASDAGVGDELALDLAAVPAADQQFVHREAAPLQEVADEQAVTVVVTRAARVHVDAPGLEVGAPAR